MHTYSRSFGSREPDRRELGQGNPDWGTRTGEPGLGNPDWGNPDWGNPAYGEPGPGEPGLWGTRPMGNPDRGNPDSATSITCFQLQCELIRPPKQHESDHWHHKLQPTNCNQLWRNECRHAPGTTYNINAEKHRMGRIQIKAAASKQQMKNEPKQVKGKELKHVTLRPHTYIDIYIYIYTCVTCYLATHVYIYIYIYIYLFILLSNVEHWKLQCMHRLGVRKIPRPQHENSVSFLHYPWHGRTAPLKLVTDLGRQLS